MIGMMALLKMERDEKRVEPWPAVVIGVVAGVVVVVVVVVVPLHDRIKTWWWWWLLFLLLLPQIWFLRSGSSPLAVSDPEGDK